jgi:hypothetical protein
MPICKATKTEIMPTDLPVLLDARMQNAASASPGIVVYSLLWFCACPPIRHLESQDAAKFNLNLPNLATPNCSPFAMGCPE